MSCVGSHSKFKLVLWGQDSGWRLYSVKVTNLSPEQVSERHVKCQKITLSSIFIHSLLSCFLIHVAGICQYVRTIVSNRFSFERTATVRGS